jgi:hypothetical protein
MPVRFAMLAVAFLFVATAWAGDIFVVEDWSKLPVGAKGVPDGWKGDQIWGNPKHDFTIVENDGHRAIHLKSRNDSSAITKELTGKWRLKETPVLEWSWKVVVLPKGADSRSKHTDDQAAQLYVVWPRFPKELRSRLIGYIWDTAAPAGLIVKSEKTSMVTYVVVRSGATGLGTWLTERRNVVEDFKKIYGEEPENPEAISIAIDSDDTNSAAESFFGAIAFKRR